MKHFVSTDYSNGSDAVLIIRKTYEKNNENYTEETRFNASDEDNISDFVTRNMGEMLHGLSGCPIYMEIAGWSAINAGSECKYPLDDYDDLEPGWEVELITVE